MATKNGTVSQRSTKYDFYVVYTKTFSATTMRWKLTASVYLRVIKASMHGNAKFELYMAGKKRTSFNMTKQYGSADTTKVYALGSYSIYSDASFTKKSIAISATLVAPSGGYGPGTCKCSFSVALDAKLFDQGHLKLLNKAAYTVNVNAYELPQNVGYDKVVKFYYRPATASTFISAGEIVVPDKDSECTMSIKGLYPDKEVTFKYEAFAPTGIRFRQRSYTSVMNSDNYKLTLDEVTEESIAIKVLNFVPSVGYIRELKVLYRKVGASDWKEHTVKVVSASSTVTTYTFEINNLVPNTRYEFRTEVRRQSNDIFLASETILAATLASDTDYKIDKVSFTTDAVHFSVRHFISNATKKVAVYIRDEDGQYYLLGEVSKSFTVGVSTELVFAVATDDAILRGLLSDSPFFKIFFLDSSRKIEEIHHYKYKG